MPKGVYPHAHVRPKVYPAEMVAEVRALYEAGQTQAEIAAKLGRSQKVIWTLMRNHGIQARPGTREQRGEANPNWTGDAAGYDAFHKRVEVARGRPQACSSCGKTGPGIYEWANLTGHYEDVNDYARLCRHCHRQLDGSRRKANGGVLTSTLRGGGEA